MHGLKEVDDAQLKSLGTFFGTYWTREQVERMFESGGDDRHRSGPLQELITPLSLVLSEGRLQDWLKRQFGASLGIAPPDWFKQSRGQVVEGSTLKLDEFIKLAQMFTPLIPKGQ